MYILLYTHMQSHAEHNNAIIMTTGHSLKKYTSPFIWKVCVWDGVGDRTDLQHIDPHSYGHQRLFPALQGCSTGGLGAHSAADFLNHILSPKVLISKLVSKLTDFLSSLSYIIVQSPTQYLWNGMFDCHQAEITVMQFTVHSLPVHQSMTLAWDFTLSHIVSQARLRDFFP